MKKWFVEFPTYKYKENVKELATKNRLKVVDARFRGSEEQCDNPPKLTLKGAKTREVRISRQDKE